MTIVTHTTSDYADTTVRYKIVDLLNGVLITEFEDPSHLDRSGYVEKDVTKRNWKTIIRNGDNATTYLHGTKYRADFTSGYGQSTLTQYENIPVEEQDSEGNTVFLSTSRGDVIDRKQVTVRGALMFPGASFADPADLVAADNQALEHFYSKMRQAQSSFSGGTFLGELREAIEGIRHPAEAVTSFLHSHIKRLSKRKTALKKAIRSGDKSAVKNLTGYSSGPEVQLLNQMAAKSWLEAQYHWIPLISDVKSAAETMAGFSDRHDTKRVQATGRSVVTGPDSDVTNDIYAPFVLKYKRAMENSVDVRYYGAVKLKTPDSTGYLDSVQQAFGLNMSNFVPTIYNLIPFSFVLDYFSNIGSLVDIMSFPNSSIAWAARTIKTRSNDYCHSPHVITPESYITAQYEYSLSPGITRLKYDDILRTPIDAGSLGIPDVEFKLPGISKKWLNLTALGVALSDFRRS